MSRPQGTVFDIGLQAERTALAWRRTALAMAVAAVGAGRLVAPTLGVAAGVLAGLGLLQAVLVARSAQRRYAAVHDSLTERGDLRAVRQGGLAIAAMAVSGGLVSVLALLFALLA